MQRLNNISLTNIRRFGRDIQIPISSGATVFLAPNGTGKTAIFEAVEFALTGSVQRLRLSLDPLISDGANFASVRLTFDDGAYCEANITRGREPVLAGDHEKIFKDINRGDIPFLIQLTHILSQHNSNWFVNNHGSSAGNLLDRLSIGKSASTVNQMIPSVKRAAQVELNNAEREFAEASSIWEKWQELKSKRTSLSQELAPDIPSVEDLRVRLDEIGTAMPGYTTSSASTTLDIKSELAGLKQSTENFIDGLSNEISEKQNLVQVIAEHQRSSDEMAKVRLDKARILEQISTNLEKIQDSKRTLETLAEIQQDRIGILEKSRGFAESFSQMDVLETETKAIRQAMISLDDSRRQLVERQASLIERIKIQETRNRTLSDIASRRKELAETVGLRDNRSEALKRWEQLEASQRELQAMVIPEIDRRIEIQERELAYVIEKEQVAADNFAKSNLGLSALNEAQNVIHECVAKIHSALPKDSSECPVCSQHYEPEELQQRITLALGRINPGINALMEQVEKGREEVTTLRTRITDINLKIGAESDEKQRILERIRRIEQQIGELRLVYFDPNDTRTDAAKTLEESSRQVLEKEERLSELLKVEITPIQEASDDLDIQLSDIGAALSRVQSNISINTDKLSELEKNYQEALQKALSIPPRDEVNQTIMQTTREIDENDAKIESSKIEIASLELSDDSLNDRKLRIEAGESQLEIKISQFRNQWIRSGLSGDMSGETIAKAINALENDQNTSIANRKKLQEMDIQIAKREVLERNSSVEEEMSALKREESEAAYEERILKAQQEKANKLNAVSMNTKILTAFSTTLAKELEVVHERVKAINPLWNRLLSRIIIEPRFANTHLDSYSYYKKPHADVNVKLHGDDVLVSQVASEAQITDLQLTFLLAMAQKYKWTPWKSVLLDDPTQHHDLVHASSIFDLLRDYIADFGFQIITTTHDPVQAKFFIRKLQNDGIPASLVVLKVEEGGVAASNLL